ncbi:DUF6351 family protein [Prauserella muralis]|uniref:Uncharacterized protein n=1 Tax=Prauserella muralis TaxID=588067 RepID=A0A2V4AM24_9PSEU|nr:DUF6351 family protein [Prauserella muralis]PXY21341.1 hypothetical protein BAY60_28295 [Prauserella muralis]TWE30469.1 hypothetical protein FHX69_3171 [Prauserella muralis]
MRRSVIHGAVAALTALACLAGAAPAVADEPAGNPRPCLVEVPAGTSCVEGSLPDSTPYRFVVPSGWNGAVLVDLDFAGRPLDDPYIARMLDRGFAMGGTTRTVTGWRLTAAAGNQAAALERFVAAFGEPRWAIASGSSMGGMISALTAQRHPESFDAAVPFCGGLGGAVGQWNQKLDTVFTLKTLLFPGSDLPVTGIPADIEGARQAWQSSLARAQTTPEGRARIALAAAIGQLPSWGHTASGTPTPMPDPGDTAALQEGMYLALSGGALPYIGQAMSSRHTIERLAGGNPSWNTGVDYAEQLAAAEPRQRRAVGELYRRAGLDLRADLRTLAGTSRIAADPGAVEYLERTGVFTGDIRIPVLTVNPIGDQISTVAQQQAYESVVRASGNGALLRQSYVRTAGHCTFSTGEREAAIAAIMHRLRTGHWDGMTTPATLNSLAESAPGAEQGRYLPYRPARFNRPYFGA